MKEYKRLVLDALIEKSHEIREIPLKETAQSVGVKRLSSFEVHEIAARFVKECPSYRPVLMLSYDQKHKGAPYSAWETLIFTELEYDDDNA